MVLTSPRHANLSRVLQMNFGTALAHFFAHTDSRRVCSCTNKRCIPKGQRCDFFADCAGEREFLCYVLLKIILTDIDGSDEVNCGAYRCPAGM